MEWNVKVFIRSMTEEGEEASVMDSTAIPYTNI